ncbi:MAG TPA: MlaD family protein [Vicinamibacteria bacterium]|nr:MlaD family protein [Vicinamibacteria bacterium]
MTDREPPPKEDEDIPPPPVARSKDRAILVGVFVIFGLVAVLLSLFTFTDAAFFRGRYIVTTHVSNAGGIRRGDPVQMRGVNIGRIQRFKISHDDVAIRLEIEGEYDVPADSKVVLKSAGIVGGMVADVIPGISDKKVGNGDTLPGASETSLSDITSRISTQAETVLSRMEALLDKPTIDNVHASSADLSQVLKTLSATVTEQRRELRDIAQSLHRSTASMEKITGAPEWDRTLKRVDSMTEQANVITRRLDGVSTTLEKSSQSMQSVLGRVERGEGSLGKLTKDEKLYDRLSEAAANMNQASVNLSKLADDIRKDPKRYLSIKVF